MSSIQVNDNTFNNSNNGNQSLPNVATPTNELPVKCLQSYLGGHSEEIQSENKSNSYKLDVVVTRRT